jgi:rod shape-determining protein MreD
MIEHQMTSRWAIRTVTLALSLAILGLQIQPNLVGSSQKVLPDLLFILFGALCLRRPDVIPLAMIGGVMLLADFVLMRPPGLYALLSTIAAAWLLLRHEAVREGNFLFEWLQFTIAFAVVLFFQRLISLGLLLPVPPWMMELRLFLWTVFSYPIVCLTLYLLLRVRRLVPGERDTMGQLR